MSSIIPFDGDRVPSHIAKRFANSSSNTDLTGGVGSGGYPVISYKGKVWHVVQGENRTLVANEDGDPRSSIEVVILKANPALSKIYYASGYEEGSNAKPTCFSTDGVAPSKDAQEPQSAKCATCPHNAWGSRVTETGAKGKACSDSRRLAVAPAGDLENPMLLRVPAGSLKELVAYAQTLERRKANYQAVVTKIGFDHTVAHQKFTFKAIRWLDDAEADTVLEVVERDVIANITGAESDDFDLPGEPPKAMVKEQPAPKKPAPKFAASEDEVESAMAPKAKPEPVETPAPKAAKKPDVAAIIAEADASLDDVLSMLDD